MPKLRHGSLFSGIGGFDLAAEWMGWENVFHCEWNDFGKKILKYYWPNAISYDDITKTDFSVHRGQIDILTGGFPCQPYSMAGKRKGKEDERHLWPQMLRAIREIQPRWIVGENVYGLVNWSKGLVFHEVQADLEAAGYEVQPFLLPAVSVGAPHRRDRIWFVAYRNSPRFQEERAKQQTTRFARSSIQWTTSHASDIRRNARRPQQSLSRNSTDGTKTNASYPNDNGLNECDSQHEVNASEGRLDALSDISKSNGDGIASNTNCFGQEWKWKQRFFNKEKERGKERFRKLGDNEFNRWEKFPTVSPVCHGNDGLSDRLDAITFSKWRQESIKGGGNAVVPPLVLSIFKTIDEYDRSTDSAALDP